MDNEVRHVDVAIVGSGFAGLGVAIQLKRQRVTEDFVILEAADDVGGTWRDNSYPGCACDVPSHLYSFSFAPNPACGVTPMSLLKTGGLGVREIRRIAKTTGVPEAATRLWLEMAYAGDILDVDDDELMPTQMFDEWLATPPAGRLLALIALWWNMRTVPLIDKRPEGIAASAALAPDSYGAIGAELRRDVLGAAADLPAG